MIPSWYQASSPINDKSAGGYAGTHNPPNTWTGKSTSSSLVLIEISDQEAPFMNVFKGFQFRIVNQTDHMIAFQGVDSTLPVIIQAFVSGEWKPLQFKFKSYCGNSYHILCLPAKSFWNLTAPIFHGKTHMLLRLKVELLNGQTAYSREFPGYINKKQTTRNDTVIPENVWDQITLAIVGPMQPDLPEPEIPITTDTQPDEIDFGPFRIPPSGKKAP
ncbi:MAG: hypothetical protein GXO70_11225 [Acidobacteria bacterium]|nr:hypothetical protein [Acidobacteriota bacterium]